MIEVDGITVKLSGKTILNNICGRFDSGLIHGIVGLNGAGKTTFFNTIAKSIKPVAGNITFKNKPLLKQQTEFLETDNYFYSGITGSEYLKIFSQTNLGFQLERLQALFKLPLDDLIENYSTGMKKKLALLGLLKKDKDIYLFDEPFNGLDMETGKVVELIFTALKKKNKTLFISSHIIDPLLSNCDQIHFMESGALKKTYQKSSFHLIEEELFGNFKVNARSIISESV